MDPGICPWCEHLWWKHSVDSAHQDGWLVLFCTECTCPLPQAKIELP